MKTKIRQIGFIVFICFSLFIITFETISLKICSDIDVTNTLPAFATQNPILKSYFSFITTDLGFYLVVVAPIVLVFAAQILMLVLMLIKKSKRDLEYSEGFNFQDMVSMDGNQETISHDCFKESPLKTMDALKNKDDLVDDILKELSAKKSSLD
ncbi:MAG: hypothetical protein K0R90_277 [Oscillospiraceae bacterium]|nr:hypothetical protein [Oscillospiraceae bacterium]